MEKKEPVSDEHIKYLGFDVCPGKIGKFWGSDEEKDQYLKRIKSRKRPFSILDRDAAILNVRLMTTTDKAISLLGSLMLVVSFFLPVYSVQFHDQNLTGSAISLFANLPFILGYASWSGPVMVLAIIALLGIVISCPAVGVLNAVGLFNKSEGSEAKQRCKSLITPLLIKPIGA